MLRPVIKTVVTGLVILLMVILGDMIAGSLSCARDTIAEQGNVTTTTEYSDTAIQIFAGVTWIVLLIMAGVFLVYAIHVKKR